MTPEQRAAETVKIAAAGGIPGAKKAAARWHSLITSTVRDALLEARTACTYIPDKDAIGKILVTSGGSVALTQAEGGSIISCLICGGSGKLESERQWNGSETCYGCNGRGVIVDTGA